MTDYLRRQFHPTQFPRIGDRVHLDLDAYFAEKVQEQARATDELVEQTLRDAAEGAYQEFKGKQDESFYVRAEETHTAWDDPDASPWLDVSNAMLAMHGQPLIIDARRPVDDVYQITKVK